ATRFREAAEQLEFRLRPAPAGEREGKVGVLEIPEAQTEEARRSGAVLEVVQLDRVGAVSREHCRKSSIAAQGSATLRPGQLHAARVEEFDDRVDRRAE